METTVVYIVHGSCAGDVGKTKNASSSRNDTSNIDSNHTSSSNSVGQASEVSVFRASVAEDGLLSGPAHPFYVCTSIDDMFDKEFSGESSFCCVIHIQRIQFTTIVI